MEENNVHTSVVIELANQEEPKDQKTYQIDIDEVEIPKDYVIDQVFCGENITVYTLFEVSEEASKSPDKRLVEVSNSNLNEDYRFIHRKSYNNTMNEKKINGYRHNLSVMHSEEDLKFITNKDNGNGSLYCLKHLGGDYDVLTPERKTSDLKVLYNKEYVSKNVKPSKFKVVSKGVNTDVVQSPKIVDEVQKAVGLNFPFFNDKDKNNEVSTSSIPKSAYEVIEMEMRPSFTSLSSNSDCRRSSKKSTPNFFFVPLLMMEDGALSHFKKDKRVKKENKVVESKLCITPKISLGTNTDLTFERIEQGSTSACPDFESPKTDTEHCEEEKNCEKKKTSDVDVKANSKELIVQEIKKMQEKLNALIKTIEENDFLFTTKDEEQVVESDKKSSEEETKNLERKSEPLLCETFPKSFQNFDDRPIFVPFTYPSFSNEPKTKPKRKSPGTSQTKKSENFEIEFKISNPNGMSSNCPSSASLGKNDEVRIDVKAVDSNSSLIICQELGGNRKSIGLSKSESNVRVLTSEVKHNGLHGLKKSLSLDLKDDKVEVLRKIKNFSFKLEGNAKMKANIRILQNKEADSGDNSLSLICEMGDDVSRKPKTSNNDLLHIAQKNEKPDKVSSKETNVDAKKTFNEEEGDAKAVYQKENLTLPTYDQSPPKVPYYNTNVVSSEGILKPKKSLSPYRVKSRTVDKISEPVTKMNAELEKPITPNKSCRKINSTDLNAKKDIKVNKKINNKAKAVEKANKFEGKDAFQPELDKKKSILSGIRKSTRNSADSKLHVDKLIKLDILSNHKIPPLSKSNHDEKPGPKNERLSRPVSQKRERSEHPIEVLPEEKVTSEFKVSSNKSVTLVGQNDACETKCDERSNFKEDNNDPKKKEKMKEEIASNIIPLTSNPSSVVVELFSKKPKSVDDFYSEVGQECANLEKTLNGKQCGAEKVTKENSKNQDKPIVKSVWALTKVLLFEDGTKKLEVLEASLTPPGYSLNQTLKSENETENETEFN